MSDSLFCNEVMRVATVPICFSDMLEPAVQYQAGSCRSTHFSFADDNTSGGMANGSNTSRCRHRSCSILSNPKLSWMDVRSQNGYERDRYVSLSVINL